MKSKGQINEHVLTFRFKSFGAESDFSQLKTPQKADNLRGAGLVKKYSSTESVFIQCEYQSTRAQWGLFHGQWHTHTHSSRGPAVFSEYRLYKELQLSLNLTVTCTKTRFHHRLPRGSSQLVSPKKKKKKEKERIHSRNQIGCLLMAPIRPISAAKSAGKVCRIRLQDWYRSAWRVPSSQTSKCYWCERGRERQTERDALETRDVLFF